MKCEILQDSSLCIVLSRQIFKRYWNVGETAAVTAGRSDMIIQSLRCPRNLTICTVFTCEVHFFQASCVSGTCALASLRTWKRSGCWSVSMFNLALEASPESKRKDSQMRVALAAKSLEISTSLGSVIGVFGFSFLTEETNLTSEFCCRWSTGMQWKHQRSVLELPFRQRNGQERSTSLGWNPASLPRLRPSNDIHGLLIRVIYAWT